MGYCVPFGWSGLFRSLGAQRPVGRLPGGGPRFSRADYTIKCNKKEKGSQESTNLVKWKNTHQPNYQGGSPVSYHHLTRKERGKIALWKNNRLSIREIASRLGRSPSTISRELSRNTTGQRYRADDAQKNAHLRALIWIRILREQGLGEKAFLCGVIPPTKASPWGEAVTGGDG